MSKLGRQSTALRPSLDCFTLAHASRSPTAAMLMGSGWGARPHYCEDWAAPRILKFEASQSRRRGPKSLSAVIFRCRTRWTLYPREAARVIRAFACGFGLSRVRQYLKRICSRLTPLPRPLWSDCRHTRKWSLSLHARRCRCSAIAKDRVSPHEIRASGWHSKWYRNEGYPDFS